MLPDSVTLNIIWAEAGWAGLPYFEWENDATNPDRFTMCPPDSLVDSQKCWRLHLHIGLGSVGSNYYDLPIRLAGTQETVVDDRVVVRRVRGHLRQTGRTLVIHRKSYCGDGRYVVYGPAGIEVQYHSLEALGYACEVLRPEEMLASLARNLQAVREGGPDRPSSAT